MVSHDRYHNRYPGKGTTGTIYAQDANKSLVSCCALLFFAAIELLRSLVSAAAELLTC